MVLILTFVSSLSVLCLEFSVLGICLCILLSYFRLYIPVFWVLFMLQSSRPYQSAVSCRILQWCAYVNIWESHEQQVVHAPEVFQFVTVIKDLFFPRFEFPI